MKIKCLCIALAVLTGLGHPQGQDHDGWVSIPAFVVESIEDPALKTSGFGGEARLVIDRDEVGPVLAVTTMNGFFGERLELRVTPDLAGGIDCEVRCLKLSDMGPSSENFADLHGSLRVATFEKDGIPHFAFAFDVAALAPGDRPAPRRFQGSFNDAVAPFRWINELEPGSDPKVAAGSQSESGEQKNESKSTGSPLGDGAQENQSNSKGSQSGDGEQESESETHNGDKRVPNGAYGAGDEAARQTPMPTLLTWPSGMPRAFGVRDLYGRRQGVWTTWTPNGVLQSVGEWRDGLRDGAFASFTPAGERFDKGQFAGGEATGLWKQWRSFLWKRSVWSGRFEASHKVGAWLERALPETIRSGNDLEGVLRSKQTFDDAGAPLLWTVYDSNGAKRSEGPFDDGDLIPRPTSEWTHWDSDPK